jgi:molybdate transport system substrate-binding protein
VRRLPALLLLLSAALLPTAGQAATGATGAGRTAPGLNVYAAASLTDAFRDIGNLWLAKGHAKISFNFASSGVLAQQIAHGAPANVFASADELWMDKLQAEHRIKPGTRSDVVSNALVLVEPKARLKPIQLKQGAKLASVLGPDGRLAVGEPGHVPAGIYAEQALRRLGLWDSVKARLAPADNVRSALMLVTSGEAPAGIVYATDARLTPMLGVAATFPPDSHDPIRYPVAVTASGGTTEALAFVAFLHTQPAQDVFVHYGFAPP